jgi:tRNA nucleotidyltransferase/poly(A) polymerase
MMIPMNDLLNRVKFGQERALLRALGEFADKIKVEGFIVGGYVRDVFLGVSSKDIDIVVLGDGPAFAAAFAETYHLPPPAIFHRYGTAQFKVDEIEVEIVGARKESYTEESIKPEVVTGTLEDDVYRRDFTINTLLFPLNRSRKQQVIDITGLGIPDLLHNKVIRTPLDPIQTFTDDPSRILRAIRFASKFHFTIHPDTIMGIKDSIYELYRVPIEKVRDELNKILILNDPQYYFQLMKDFDILRVAIPGLDLLFYIKQNLKYHRDTAGEHSLAVLGKIQRKDLVTRLAALMHDFGKIDHTFVTETGEIKSPGHEHSKLPKIALQRLKYDNTTIAKVMLIIELHMRLAQRVEEVGIRKLIRDANGVLNELLDVIEADQKSQNYPPSQKLLELINYIRNYDAKKIEQIQKITPSLSGNELITLLQYPSPQTTKNWNQLYGVRIGQIQKLLVEALIAQNIENTKDAATQFVLNLPKEILYP